MTSAAALRNAATGSAPPSKAPKGRPVRDFLYHDSRRVGSFLAQFETYGLLQQVKSTESVGQISARKTTIGAGVKVPMVAHGQAAKDETTTDEERDAAERVYDPLWTHARILLDYLTSEGMVQTDIRQARIGQFVLMKGHLVVLDVAMLKGA